MSGSSSPLTCKSFSSKRSGSKVRLDGLELGEQSGGLLVGHAGVDNDVLAGGPVDGGGDSVLVTSLERVDDSQDLSGVSAGGGGVLQNQTDGLLGVDDEDGSDGEGNSLGVHVGGILVVDHVVQKRDLSSGVGNDGESELGVVDLINVLDPGLVRRGVVGRETNELDASLGELGLELGESSELGGADGSEIIGVREENSPVVANEVVELDGTVGGVGLEVGGLGAKSERSTFGSHCDSGGTDLVDGN